jgi:hypothetical protein
MADNLPHSSADVTESGSLNLPEPCGPHRPVMGLVYLFFYSKNIKQALLSFTTQPQKLAAIFNNVKCGV